MKRIKSFSVFVLAVIMLCMMCVNVVAEGNPEFEKYTFSLRLGGEKGIRVKAGIETETAFDELTTEFGFIVTRKVFLDNKNIAVEDFSIDSDVRKVTNCAKKIVDGNSLENFFDVTDETTYFTGVFTGIDESHYDEVLVSRPYVIYNNETYYGNSASASYAQIARALQGKEDSFNQLTYEERRAIDDIVRRADGFTKEIKENLIIPTTLNDTKPIREVEDIVYVYAFVDGEGKYVPVDTEYYEIYEDEICSYRVRNGLYCITPLAYVEDEDGEYIGIEKDDDSMLNYKNPKRTFYIDANYPEFSIDENGMLTIDGVDKKLEYVDGHSKIIIRSIAPETYDDEELNYICEYTMEELVASDIASLDFSYVKLVMSNNIDSTESEYIDVIYLVIESDKFEDKTPAYPVPEIKVGAYDNFIIPIHYNQEEVPPRSYFEEDLARDIWFINVFLDDRETYVAVNTDKVLPKVIDNSGDFPYLNDEYNFKLSSYAVDKNGVYHIKPLGYDLDDKTGEYNGIEKEDITVLDGDDEDALFYTEVTNTRFYRDNGYNFAAGLGRNVNIENAKIFVTEHIIDEENGIFEDRTFAVDYKDMKTMLNIASRISLLVQNNPSSNTSETLVAAYIQTDNFEYELCENIGHNYIVIDKKNATCEADGYTKYLCGRVECTEKYKTEVIPATGHKMEMTIPVKASCERDGYELYECQNSGCNYSYTRDLPAIGHKIQTTISSQPTCSTVGYKLHKCQRSGCGYWDKEVIPATGHKPGAWTIVTQPTCTTSGVETSVCTVCNAVEEKVIKALGHNYEVIESREPTCLKDGFAILKCTRHGCEEQKRQYLEAKGHSFGDDNICDACGEIVEICNHNYSIVDTVAATCTTMGYTQHTCTECDDFYRDDYIEPLGHKLKEGAISIERTCTTPGRQKYTCEREGCGMSEDRIIPAGHNWSVETSIAPTCHADGEATKTCMSCGETVTEIVKASHKWEDVEVVKQPACETEGEKSCRCSVCKETQIFKIPAVGHRYKNGYCEVCHEHFSDNIVYLEENDRYGMYFSVDDIVSAYGPEIIDEYGVYLDYNEGAKIDKVAVFLTQDGTMWRRSLAFTGSNISSAYYVPYLARDGELYYSGLNHSWINTFRLTKNSDGIYTYGNFVTIGVNLEDNKGNLLLTLADIGSISEGDKTQVFTDLEAMKKWLLEDACAHSWIDDGFETEPTCTKGGVKKQKCSCGETRTVGVKALGHSMGEWFTVDKPTTEEKGIEKRECKNCDYFETKDIPQLEVEEKFNPSALAFVVADKDQPGHTVAELEYCDATGKDEYYIECYIDGEIVRIPLNLEQFCPGFEERAFEDDLCYLGDVYDDEGISIYISTLANIVRGDDGRYVVKPVLHLENKNGDYIGVNRDAEGIFDDSEKLFGNHLADWVYTGYLNKLADGRVQLVDEDGLSLVGEIDEDVIIDYLKLTDETRIIIRDKNSKSDYREFTMDTFISSVVSPLTNIQYVITGADRDASSADLLVLYAETYGFAEKEYTVTYTYEGATVASSKVLVKEYSTLTLPKAQAVSGKSFSHWSIGDEIYNPGDKIYITGDVVITGKYVDKFVVSYVYSCCKQRTTVECENGEVITLPEAHACEDYSFDGWKITGTGITTVTMQPGDEYTVTSNVTITGVTTRLYEVTYNFGCCTEVHKIDYRNGTRLTLAAPEHLCDDYEFVNYDINGRVYKVGSTITVNKDITIKVEVRKLHTVYVHSYYETDDALIMQGTSVYKVADGEYFELPEYPKFDNYKVENWIVSSGSTSVIKNEFDEIQITEDTTVRAEYTKIVNVKLICQINGGEEYNLQYKDGTVIVLSDVHPDSKHIEEWDEWWFEINGETFSPESEVTVTDGMEITCYAVVYPRFNVTVHHIYDNGEDKEAPETDVVLEGETYEIPDHIVDDYSIFNGWFVNDEECISGDIITVNGDVDICAYYTNVPTYKPGMELDKEVVDLELLEMASQAREEIRSVRVSNAMHKKTKQEIVDTIKFILNDIYQGIAVDENYVRAKYETNIESIKYKINEEMTKEERSTFANVVIDGISGEVKTFLSDHFGIDLDNIEL